MLEKNGKNIEHKSTKITPDPAGTIRELTSHRITKMEYI